MPSASPPASSPFVGGELPVRLRAWDGSETGPVDAPRVVVNSPDALKRLIWRPGELGAAQAYVSGEIDVDHDLDDALTHVWAVAEERGLSGIKASPAAVAALLRVVRDFGPRPAAGAAGQPGAGCVAGCTPSCGTGRRSATTTTCPTTSTR